MRIYPVNDLPSVIHLGKQTEKGVREIRLDCAVWKALWPSLDISVWVTPPGGEAAYPAVTHMEGDVLVWPINDSDTAVSGDGYMEVMGMAEGLKKLSAIATTRIMSTTTGTTTEPPEPAKPWVDQVIEAADRAEAAAVHPPIIGDNGNWYLWNFERGEYVDSNVSSGGGETVEVDVTLTQEGKAADAKAAGDRISQLYKEIAEQTMVEGDVVVCTYDDFTTTALPVTGGQITNYHSPLIDISGEYPVEVRVWSYEWTLTEKPANHSPYIAQFDSDGVFIEGSRGVFSLQPLNESGKILNDSMTSDMSQIGVENLLWRYGAGRVIAPAEGAKYAVIFNFRAGAAVDLEVTTKGPVSRFDLVEKRIKNAESAIENLEKKVPSAINPILHEYPELNGCADYVHPLAMDVAKAAKAHIGENDLCLILFTDTHYKEGSTFIASKIAKHLAELTNAAAILHLGDLTDGLTDAKNVWLDLWQEGTVVLSGRIPYLQAVGNHDDGTLYNRRQGDLSASNYATSTDMFIATTQNARRYISLGSKRGWYYIDDEDSKTRIIMLNSHDYPWEVDESGNLANDNSTIKAAYSPEQLDWLANVAFDFSQKTDRNDWTAVVCGHGMGNRSNVVYIMDNAKSGTKITTLPHADQYNAYDYSGIVVTADYSVAHPKQVIMLRGDDHMDALNTSGNFPIVTFLNASLAKDQTSAPVKTLGTPTETCVSVLVFNNDTGTMREVRFGAGPSDPLTGYDNYRVVEYGSGYVKS